MIPSEFVWTVVNHLWQSTVVVAIAWLLAQAFKRNHARMRYCVWFAASIKFLLPFSLLIRAGERFRSLMPATSVAKPAVAQAMERMTQPCAEAQFFDATQLTARAPHHVEWWPVLVAAGLCGHRLE